MSDQPVRAVVFDLDGTLVDTPRAIVSTFSAAFAELGAPAQEAAAIRATIGMPLEKAFGSLLGIAPDDPLVILGIEHYQRFFKELILPSAPDLLIDGVAEGLAGLADAEVALAVATSKYHRSADTLLDAAGLLDLFAVVVGADDVSNPKPHPESGEKALAELGLPASAAVMVGDTTHDLLMARAAGMRSIGVTYGVHDRTELAAAEPTWLVDTFPQVLDCVRETAQEGATR